MAAVMAAELPDCEDRRGKLCPWSLLEAQGKGSLTADSYFAKAEMGFNRN
ncbi:MULTISPECIES: hypothetical protein [unclassified Ensifer]|nr:MULTISPECIES: hypothetical protein [unclassified Ensifer]